MSKPQPPPVAEKKAGDTTKVPANEKQEIEEKKKLPQLGALEDDDEFEVCQRLHWVPALY